MIFSNKSKLSAIACVSLAAIQFASADAQLMDQGLPATDAQAPASSAPLPSSTDAQAPLTAPGGQVAAVSPVAPAPAPPHELPKQVDHAQKQLSEANLKADLNLLDSVSINGWNGSPAIGLLRANNALVLPDGNVAHDISVASPSLLVEYGCTDVVNRAFHRGQRTCIVHLTRFEKSNGAYGAYSTLREGSSTVVLRGQASSEDDNCICFWKGNVFVKLTTTAEDDDEAKEALGKIADEVLKKLEGTAELPLPIKALPSFEKLHGSEKFFMGAEGAHRYVNVPFIEELQIGKSGGAGHADYQYASPMSERLALLIVDYKAPAQAKTVFDGYVENIASLSNKVLQKSSNEALCKVSDSYLMCLLNGQRVYVISGARRKFSPGILARQLK